jgi:hypothetical protein
MFPSFLDIAGCHVAPEPAYRHVYATGNVLTRAAGHHIPGYHVPYGWLAEIEPYMRLGYHDSLYVLEHTHESLEPWYRGTLPEPQKRDILAPVPRGWKPCSRYRGQELLFRNVFKPGGFFRIPAGTPLDWRLSPWNAYDRL